MLNCVKARVLFLIRDALNGSHMKYKLGRQVDYPTSRLQSHDTRIKILVNLHNLYV